MYQAQLQVATHRSFEYDATIRGLKGVYGPTRCVLAQELEGT